MNINNLVTGGAGFIGSNLIEKLLNFGEKVICVDDLSTGSIKNIRKWEDNKNFIFYNHNILNSLNIENKIDRIWHLACPASPYYFLKDPINTSRIAFHGTYNMLELAKKCESSILITSTSEIYGESQIVPQEESNYGDLNVKGNRACYAEAKRLAETISYEYQRKYNLNIKVARVFNTYGPGLRVNDKRVISNFIVNSLQNKPLQIFGKGLQTRSFCFVDDLVDGLILFMNSDFNGPCNLGNNEEISILDLAKLVLKKTSSSSVLEYCALPNNEAFRRIPSLKLAKKNLNWIPILDIDKGLDLTIDFFKKEIK